MDDRPPQANESKAESHLPMADRSDVLVIGAGPAGSIAARQLALKGRAVTLIEKSAFPRFHIGESMLPGSMALLRKLGLDQALGSLPQVPKFGAEFGMGGSTETTDYDFAENIFFGNDDTFNIERCAFDRMLLDEARQAGATVLQPTKVDDIESLEDGDVRLRCGEQTIQGKWLIDASGQGTVLGRKLGTRRRIEDRCFQKVAHFAQVKHDKRRAGKREGHPLIVMAEEGWFWLIPLDAERTSVGLVLDAQVARGLDVPASEVLRWGIARCPLVLDRLGEADIPAGNAVISDYSYRCEPFAGPGHFLIGDAAAFLDPVFSTGVHLGMTTALLATDAIDQLLNNAPTAKQADAVRRRYVRSLQAMYRPYFDMIRGYYRHPFRELFLQGRGPFNVHKAVITLLTGHAVPNMRWSIKWRLAFFRVAIAMQQRFALAPRRDRFSLLKQEPVALPAPADPQREAVLVGAA